MDSITYPASAHRRIKSALRGTGSTKVTLTHDEGVTTFEGLNAQDEVRVAGTVAADAALAYTTKPNKTKPAPKGQKGKGQAAKPAASDPEPDESEVSAE